MYKNIYFVDTENQGTHYVNDLLTLTSNDKVILMYTDYGPKFSYPQIENFINTKANIVMEYCFSGTPNALDFQISSRIGSILKESLMEDEGGFSVHAPYRNVYFGNTPKIIIVSEDKGYYPLVEYWRARGYDVVTRPGINEEDADVEAYLHDLSISKQLETQQAYLSKAGLTIQEAEDSIPSIKLRDKNRKKDEDSKVISSVRKMLSTFKKEQEETLKKLIAEATLGMSVVQTSKSPEDLDADMRKIMLNDLKEELNGGSKDLPEVITQTIRETLVEKTPKETTVDTTVETTVETSEPIKEVNRLDIIMQQSKVKLSEIIPALVEKDLTHQERITVTNNADRVKSVVKVTKNEALILGYIAYYSKTPQEFNKVASKYMTTKEGKQKVITLSTRFIHGYLASKFKEEKAHESK